MMLHRTSLLTICAMHYKQAAITPKEYGDMFDFEDVSKKSREAFDTVFAGYADAARSFQAIATEASEFSQKAFRDGVAHVEALASVKSPDVAFDLQSKFVKASYEAYVAEATKIGEMYANMAKSAYKPFEAPVAKATASAKAAAAAAA